jgi:hypothetical protein
VDGDWRGGIGVFASCRVSDKRAMSARKPDPAGGCGWMLIIGGALLIGATLVVLARAQGWW